MIDACLRASEAASAGRTAAKKMGPLLFLGPPIQHGGVPELRALKPSQCTRSHMLTRSLPPILELQSEAGATEPGLHSSRGRERRGEVGGEFLLLCALGVSCLEDLWAGWGFEG